MSKGVHCVVLRSHGSGKGKFNPAHFGTCSFSGRKAPEAKMGGFYSGGRRTEDGGRRTEDGGRRAKGLLYLVLSFSLEDYENRFKT